MTAPHDDDTGDDTLSTVGPYGHAAQIYWEAGWRGVLPLPVSAKAPVPTGWTGVQGAWPSFPDVYAWTEGEQRLGNVALRLPQHVIGIDVDAYDGKPGAATLARLEGEHGPLPATWRATSRDDGSSGIRFFRVPEGLAWPGGFPGIEIIQHRHRYAVVWPSLHPEGRTYRWISPDGHDVIGQVPHVDDLPDLPQAWVQGVTRGLAATDVPRLELDDRTAGAWLDARGTGEPCRAVQAALRRYVADLDGKERARHDVAMYATARLAHLAAEGHTGVNAALGAFKAAWLKATADPKRTHDPAEWNRLLGGAVRIAAADPQGRTDPCDNPFHGLLPDRPARPGETPWTDSASPAPTASTTSAVTTTSAGAAAGSPTPAPSDDSPSASSTATPASADTKAADDAFEAELDHRRRVAEHVAYQRAQRDAKRLLDDEEAAARHMGTPDLLIDGASFILDTPERVPSIWGRGREIAWAEGESLMLVGPPGVGKTTLAGQLIRARLGLTQAAVLEMDVTITESKVLYLAMDRPAQAARALRRHFLDVDRQVLAERLVVWKGPPPADVARNPETFVDLAIKAGADTLVVDSVKDAAIGLSEDDVAAGYNRARQAALTAGIQLLELHHLVKRGANGTKPTTLADVYGSAWLTAGAGSVILLWGAAGDPVVELHHLKQPSAEIGPYDVVHDHETGTSEIKERVDPVRMAKQAGVGGVTARSVAKALFAADRQSGADKAEVEKARRRLDLLASRGFLAHIKAPAGSPDTWVWVKDQVPQDPLAGLVESVVGGPVTTSPEGHEGGHGALS